MCGVVETLVLPHYTASDGYYAHPPRVYMGETKISTSTPPYFRSASAITLRAGSRYDDIKEAVYLLVSVWYALKLQQSYGFQLVPNQAQQMPHLEAVNNFLFGKPKVDKFSSKRFNTELAGRRRESFIDMNEEYQKFLLTKNPNVKCSQKRFEELCTENKNGIIDRGSIDEALGILKAEGQGYVINAVRPEPNEVDVDFEIQGPSSYDVADIKTPINWGKGNEDLDVAAQRIGRKIEKQRSRMKGFGKCHYIL